MTHGLNEDDAGGRLAASWTVAQEYRGIIVRVADGQQEVQTKSRGTIELQEEVWVICEIPPQGLLGNITKGD